ncbi:MAG: hypothetical protein Q4F30_06455 [Akkermansia sp.]|nr:hypothetical protein [Akkermansia sp.]
MENDTLPAPVPSAVDICNLALSKLGESPISGIDANGTLPQRMCYMHYHPVRREVLCVNRWSFAVRQATLHSADAAAAESGHAVPHALPQDCLRVLEVRSPGWTLRGRTVFCPAGDIRLRYIADVEDTELFDPLFVEAFAVRLACKLCIPLINSTTTRQALLEEYQRIALPQASHFNAVQEHSNDEDHPLYRLWKQSLGRKD